MVGNILLPNDDPVLLLSLSLAHRNGNMYKNASENNRGGGVFQPPPLTGSLNPDTVGILLPDAGPRYLS